MILVSEDSYEAFLACICNCGRYDEFQRLRSGCKSPEEIVAPKIVEKCL